MNKRGEEGSEGLSMILRIVLLLVLATLLIVILVKYLGPKDNPVDTGNEILNETLLGVLSDIEKMREQYGSDLHAYPRNENDAIILLEDKDGQLDTRVTDTISNMKNVEFGSTNAYEYLISYSIEQGVNPYAMLAIVTQESRGNKDEISAVGAVGLTQLMPCTAIDMGLEIPQQNYNLNSEGQCINRRSKSQLRLGDERFIPKRSIEGGVAYAKWLQERALVNDIEDLFAAYNGGTGALKASEDCKDMKKYECTIDGEGYAETRAYVAIVSEFYNSIS